MMLTILTRYWKPLTALALAAALWWQGYHAGQSAAEVRHTAARAAELQAALDARTAAEKRAAQAAEAAATAEAARLAAEQQSADLARQLEDQANADASGGGLPAARVARLRQR